MPLSTQQKLDQAIEARHALMIGRRAVMLSADGAQTQYTPAELPALERYIAELRRQLSIEQTGQAPRRRRIAYVVPA